MIMKQFIHSVLEPFEAEIQDEQRKLAEIEQARVAREARQVIVHQDADLKDRLEVAKGVYSTFVKELERVANFSVENVYLDFIDSRISAEELGARLSALAAVGTHVKPLKKFAFERIVTAAEKRLGDFERQNAAALKGVKLEPTEEPPFVPATLAPEHYSNGASAKLVAQGIAR